MTSNQTQAEQDI